MPTLAVRLALLINEYQKLRDIGAGAEPWVDDVLDDMVNQEYERAMAKASGNWEPPDPPGWEDGFAENH